MRSDEQNSTWLAGAHDIVRSANKTASEEVGRLGLMMLIRAFEDTTYALKLDGSVAGSVHLGSGQEAVAVGVCAQLDLPQDVVFATYRGHAWALACGSAPAALFAEILGRECGVNGGRAGSAYLSDPKVGFMGENSIVGGGAAHAGGAALQGTFDGSGRHAVAVMGDGATNQGAVHEALNFAAFKHLPVAFIVENNGYSEMSLIDDMVAENRLWLRAAGYGINGVRVDGNDSYALSREIERWLAQPTGPVFIEAMTQRLVGHYIGDPEIYRTKAEIDALQAIEPIGRLSRELVAKGFRAEQLDDLGKTIYADVARAAEWAQAQEPAQGDTAREHVHA
jgi:TPP-dependent pyruvate/acetoin dehydrogenase alpha subunit